MINVSRVHLRERQTYISSELVFLSLLSPCEDLHKCKSITVHNFWNITRLTVRNKYTNISLNVYRYHRVPCNFRGGRANDSIIITTRKIASDGIFILFRTTRRMNITSSPESLKYLIFREKKKPIRAVVVVR